MDIVRAGGHWDCLSHHAADVANYKSDDFDYAGALSSNTRNLPKILDGLASADCRSVVLTGSVFEADEGASDDTREAFSPYGLSKTLTWQTFRFFAARSAFRLGKFVICNPIGPYEEKRFTAYLFRTWLQGKTAGIQTPEYVRDNIHVSLLARVYARFVEGLALDASTPAIQRVCPSQYAERVGDFANRVASEARQRLSNLSCNVAPARQTEFAEPLRRTGTDPVDPAVFDWREAEAWDSMVRYYHESAPSSVKQGLSFTGLAG